MSEQSNERALAAIAVGVETALRRLIRTGARGKYRLAIDLFLGDGGAIRDHSIEQSENQRKLEPIA